MLKDAVEKFVKIIDINTSFFLCTLTIMDTKTKVQAAEMALAIASTAALVTAILGVTITPLEDAGPYPL